VLLCNFYFFLYAANCGVVINFGFQFDSFGHHSLVCKRASGRNVRYHLLNDVIARYLTSAGVSLFNPLTPTVAMRVQL